MIALNGFAAVVTASSYAEKGMTMSAQAMAWFGDRWNNSLRAQLETLDSVVPVFRRSGLSKEGARDRIAMFPADFQNDAAPRHRALPKSDGAEPLHLKPPCAAGSSLDVSDVCNGYGSPLLSAVIRFFHAHPIIAVSSGCGVRQGSVEAHRWAAKTDRRLWLISGGRYVSFVHDRLRCEAADHWIADGEKRKIAIPAIAIGQVQ